MNEGHSAFLIIERLIRLMKNHQLPLAAAREVVKAGTVFTTHTPVPAGNETFEMAMIENYLSGYIQKNGIDLRDFHEMGHQQLSDTGPFEMTVLALKNSYRRNGVSALHGKVSRAMWQSIWKGLLVEEVPITHITNGVHVPTWLTSEMKDIISEHTKLDFNKDLLEKKAWHKVVEIPDQALWGVHRELKNRLFDLIHDIVLNNWEREGEDPSLIETFKKAMNPDILTIGFGRRFALYKRASLFLHDIERFKALVTHPEHPVQFVLAGKAHPDDVAGQKIIQHIVGLSKEVPFIGRIIFIEGYNMQISRRMVSGVDVWLNSPRRPLEASGTSGQKAGINGVPNLSILDGWWDEGYHGENGWTIGGRTPFKNTASQDISDSSSLYDLLEKEIIPMYYDTQKKEYSPKWLNRMRASIETVIAEYNTQRMIRDYCEKLYVPAAAKHAAVTADRFKKAQEIAEWKKSIKGRFSSLHIVGIEIEGISGDTVNANEKMTITLEINRGRMESHELQAQLILLSDPEISNIHFHGKIDLNEKEIEYIPMKAIQETGENIKYQCVYCGGESGKFKYGIRILPAHADADDYLDLNLVLYG